MALQDCLVGYTGFVGGTFDRHATFGGRYNSGNFRGMCGKDFDTLVCCGVPAVKWKANMEPEADLAAIHALRDVLATVRARRFLLVSTVDVYPHPVGMDESTDLSILPNHPYGRHRLEFEGFVRSTFPTHLVLRLPALFGQGLKKNVLFDLLHGNMLDSIDPSAIFQWYDLSRLTRDVEVAWDTGTSLVNLVPEPVPTGDIVRMSFPHLAGRLGPPQAIPARYEIRTCHAHAFGGQGGYIQGARESLEGIHRYVGSMMSLRGVP